MKIVILMAGESERFRMKNFFRPKPLIKIDGRPIIDYVVKMFSPEFEFIFVCNDKDIKKTNMKEVLHSIVPKSKIVVVKDTYKNENIKGPVFSCREAFDLIKDEEEVIINYCDFFVEWKFKDFLNKARSSDCDGAISSFKNLHPASLGDTSYAYLKTNSKNCIVGIQEKRAYTDNKMQEFASTGTYYFKKGRDLKKYCLKTIEKV